MSRWIFDHPTPGHLVDLGLDLEPGQEFDAPDEWKPEPNPHPVYKPADKKPAQPAPKE